MAGQTDDMGTVTIGAREIFDEVVAMRADVRSSLQTHAATEKTLTDMETRLRAVERWRYSVPVAVLTAVISAVVTIYTKGS